MDPDVEVICLQCNLDEEMRLKSKKRWSFWTAHFVSSHKDRYYQLKSDNPVEGVDYKLAPTVAPQSPHENQTLSNMDQGGSMPPRLERAKSHFALDNAKNDDSETYSEKSAFSDGDKDPDHHPTKGKSSLKKRGRPPKSQNREKLEKAPAEKIRKQRQKKIVQYADQQQKTPSQPPANRQTEPPPAKQPMEYQQIQEQAQVPQVINTVIHKIEDDDPPKQVTQEAIQQFDPKKRDLKRDVKLQQQNLKSESSEFSKLKPILTQSNPRGNMFGVTANQLQNFQNNEHSRYNNLDNTESLARFSNEDVVENRNPSQYMSNKQQYINYIPQQQQSLNNSMSKQGPPRQPPMINQAIPYTRSGYIPTQGTSQRRVIQQQHAYCSQPQPQINNQIYEERVPQIPQPPYQDMNIRFNFNPSFENMIRYIIKDEMEPIRQQQLETRKEVYTLQQSVSTLISMLNMPNHLIDRDLDDYHDQQSYRQQQSKISKYQ